MVAGPIYSDISKLKKIEAALRGVTASIAAVQREVATAAAGNRTTEERAVLEATGERLNELTAAAADLRRTFWMRVEELA